MIQTKRNNGLSYTVQIDPHQLVSDAHTKEGGADLGPTPHELLEAALGACTSITVQMYANRKGWNLTSCNVSMRFVQENPEAIIMEGRMEFEGDLSPEQKTRLFEIAEKCPVHKVLTRGMKIVSTYA